MAQLTINVPDAAVQRIREALGRTDRETGERILATQQEVLQRIKQFLKSQVIEYEVTQEAMAVRNTKSQENWDG